MVVADLNWVLMKLTIFSILETMGSCFIGEELYISCYEYRTAIHNCMKSVIWILLEQKC